MHILSAQKFEEGGGLLESLGSKYPFRRMLFSRFAVRRMTKGRYHLFSCGGLMACNIIRRLQMKDRFRPPPTIGRFGAMTPLAPSYPSQGGRTVFVLHDITSFLYNAVSTLTLIRQMCCNKP